MAGPGVGWSSMDDPIVRKLYLESLERKAAEDVCIDCVLASPNSARHPWHGEPCKRCDCPSSFNYSPGGTT